MCLHYLKGKYSRIDTCRLKIIRRTNVNPCLRRNVSDSHINPRPFSYLGLSCTYYSVFTFFFYTTLVFDLRISNWTKRFMVVLRVLFCGNFVMSFGDDIHYLSLTYMEPTTYKFNEVGLDTLIFHGTDLKKH